MKKKSFIYTLIYFFCLFILVNSIFSDTDIVQAASAQLNRKSATLWVGDTLQLKVRGAGKKVKWKSSKKTVATVSLKGKVKAKKAGKTIITAKTGGKEYRCKITVRKTALSAKSITLKNGASAALTLKFPKKKVRWFSSDNSIAYADGKRVYARAVGNAVITAKCNGKSYFCKINVLPDESEESRIEISAESMVINYGESAVLTLKNANKKIAWFSSDTRIAYADGERVYARSVGEAVITAKCDGKSYSCKVKVFSGETDEIVENGIYTSKEKVALYIKTYGKLPDNFITKEQARSLGWEGGSLLSYAPYKCIGGDVYSNYERTLPVKAGRTYYECDINTLGALKRGAERLVYSNDGLIYYTSDHYATFISLYE